MTSEVGQKEAGRPEQGDPPVAIRPVTVEALQKLCPILNYRQSRCIIWAARGLSNKEIASEMNTSEQVIKNNLKVVYRKLAVRDRTALIIRMMKFKYEGI
jgi:DNA-binding NarL/FixJ family response regulator